MRIAVVTGASSGIGREFARQIPRCFKNLDEIWLIARNTDRLHALKKELNAGGRKTKVRIYDGDLTRDYIYYRLLKDLGSENPDIRVLVNAAGAGRTGSAAQIGAEAQAFMTELNCKALTKMTCLCLPYMQAGSRIINVASAAAFAPQPGFAVYAATKSYVHSFSRALNRELKVRGIPVTSVCPGPVDTAFFETAGDISASGKKKYMVSPEAVVYKALDDSRKRRDVSVYGLPMKSARLMAKLLPERFVMTIMERINRY